MKVVWAAEALERLAEIEAFIARDSPQRAKQFVARLIQRGESLAHSPKRGRLVPELNLPEIREIFLTWIIQEFVKCLNYPGVLPKLSF